MVSEEQLNNIFAEVGKEYGFDKVQAEFMAFKEFKVRWQRTYKWADFKVSDYLEDAPEGVLRGLCRSLFSRIMGTGTEDYSQEMCDWVTAPEFAENKQATYIRRTRNTTRSPVGKFKDLNDSYRRLIDMGLIENDPVIKLSWTKDSSKKVGSCSVLMKSITMSSILDSDMIPDYVLDYCLYHELCHIIVGFDPSGDGHSTDLAAIEAKFPRQKDAESWIDKLYAII
ncbi:MAG: hypothetical protein WCQ23_02885 [Candidatus Methanomethylophilaceae archaeon]|jgi:hypothetical protein